MLNSDYDSHDAYLAAIAREMSKEYQAVHKAGLVLQIDAPDLAMDRTSCSRFLANQLRVLLTAAAYVLMQELRLQARRTGCARAQVSTLRLRLLKLAAWVEVSVRRVVVHLPRSFPGRPAWMRIAAGCGGIPG